VSGTSRQPVALAAGGTGGHVFPALALAEALAARGRPAVFLTDARAGALADVFRGFPVHVVRSGTPTGHNVAGKAAAGLRIVGGWWDAVRLLRGLRPAVVAGFGGYPALPTMLAAFSLGLPTLLHEQNAVLGRVNRLVAPRVRAIAASFAQTAQVRPADAARVVVTGNPVRQAVQALAAEPYRPAPADGRFELLAFGGSQGARAFAEVLPAALALLPEAARRRIVLTLQARPEDLEEVRAALPADLAAAEVAPFFADLPARLARAHLTVARAGAGTVSELAVAGRPAVLVPYAFATDDHQSANARVLADAGAAWLFAKGSFAAAALAVLLGELMGDPARLAEAARRAAAVGRPDAAARLADLVERLAGDNGAGHGHGEQRRAA